MKISRIFLVVFLIIHVSNSFSQDYLGGTNYVYFLGNQEPPTDWNSPSFNHASWDSAYSVIGYGNANDSTLVDTTQSLYVRMKFSISDVSAISKLTLLADYDDGYIAYINGVEVVRVNLGDSGTFVPYNTLATRSREMVLCRANCSPVLGYYLDSTILSKCLVNGENILAIQVHNDSIKGSDLGIQFGLVDVTNDMYDPYAPFFSAYKKIIVDSTHLPIVKIFTNEFGIENCSTKTNATMGVISNSSGYNHYTDSSNEYWGNIGIEPRGQSSLGWPKKNYSVELRDVDGNDTSVVILGMPKENDWILSGPFADRSLIRNALAYDLSSKLGQYAPRTRFCELFVNNEYLGVYVFMERIKRDEERVNIEKLPSTAIVNVTGGYILKHDKDVYSSIGIVYPKDEDITQIQRDYITNYYISYIRAMHDSVLLTDRGYRKYVDIPSFLDFTIINELGRNPDAYKFSTYMYKNSDDFDTKLHFGPVWDFDLAFSNSNFQNARSYNGWQFAESTNYKLYHKKVFKDTLLVQQFNDRWFELRNSSLHTDSLIATIDSLIAIIGPAIERNKQVWQLENDYIMGVWGQYISLTYEEDVALLKQWITDRANWMDQNMPLIYYPYTYRPPVSSIDSDEISTSVSVFPNPCVTNVFVSYSLTKPSTVKIVISSLQGVELEVVENDLVSQGEYLQSCNVSNLPNGMYIVSVYQNNKVVSVQKIVKK